MKYDYYYEPTIKTIRNDENGITLKTTMPLITKEEMTTIDNNLQDIVNSFIQKVVKGKDLILSQYIIKKQNDEKQQLISFLEDKIKEYKQILSLYERQNASLIEKARARNRISAYEEVMEHINNFVNKGDKE